MAVMFVTQQGRTLRNDAMGADDMTQAVGSVVEVVGYEIGRYAPVEFHVNTRHVVEWWDEDGDAA